MNKRYQDEKSLNQTTREADFYQLKPNNITKNTHIHEMCTICLNSKDFSYSMAEYVQQSDPFFSMSQKERRGKHCYLSNFMCVLRFSGNGNSRKNNNDNMNKVTSGDK